MRRTNHRGWWSAAVVTATLALSAAGAQASGAASPEPLPRDGFNRTADGQIAAAQRIKETMTPAERKLSSRLVVSLRRGADKGVAAALPKFKDGLARSEKGILLDVRAQVSDDLLRRMRSVHATVVHASVRTGEIRVALPEAAVLTIASWPEVSQVNAADVPITGGRAAAAALTHRLSGLTAPAPALAPVAATAGQPTQGSVVSEGDAAHGADKARAEHGVTGIGVKVCAISDGVTSLARSQSTGDLPAVDILPGQAGTGDEGTAMLEIIHDLAPGARLGVRHRHERRGLLRRQHPGLGRRRVRHHRRRCPPPPRVAIPGQPDLPSRRRGDQPRRPLLQRRRQRRERPERHLRQLRGRVRQVEGIRWEDEGHRPRLRPEQEGRPDLPARDECR